MKKPGLIVVIAVLSLNALSQSNTSLIKVIVSTDHNDWTYKVKDMKGQQLPGLNLN